MKKLIAAVVALAMVATTSVFAKAISKKTPIGVSMPTKDLQRWNQDGANMKAMLEKAGYKVDLQYANNEIATQTSQIENMITKGDKILVIASIDGSASQERPRFSKEKGNQSHRV